MTLNLAGFIDIIYTWPLIGWIVLLISWDFGLGVEREWQEGIAFYWIEEGVPSDKVTSSSLVNSR